MQSHAFWNAAKRYFYLDLMLIPRLPDFQFEDT